MRKQSYCSHVEMEYFPVPALPEDFYSSYTPANFTIFTYLFIILRITRCTSNPFNLVTCNVMECLRNISVAVIAIKERISYSFALILTCTNRK